MFDGSWVQFAPTPSLAIGRERTDQLLELCRSHRRDRYVPELRHHVTAQQSRVLIERARFELTANHLHSLRSEPVGCPVSEAALATPTLLSWIGRVVVPARVQLCYACFRGSLGRVRLLAQPGHNASVVGVHLGAVDHGVGFYRFAP